MEQPVVKYLATRQELDLLEVIEEIGFGEFYAVQRTQEEPSHTVEITAKTKNFLLALKRIGKFRKVIVHESDQRKPSTTSVSEDTGDLRR